MFRNTSEELVIRSFVDDSMLPAATPSYGIENMGLLHPPARSTSDELMNLWTETSPAHIRQRKISSELSALLAHQQVFEMSGSYQDDADGRDRQPYGSKEEFPSLQTLSWFQSSQPMTRSRSSELRKKYLAMQRTAVENGESFKTHPVSSVVNNLKESLESKRRMAAKNSNAIQRIAAYGAETFGFGNGELITPSESSGGCGSITTPNHVFGSGEIQCDSYQQLKRQAPQGQISRAGSITSSGSKSAVDGASSESTKRRREERKRMMDEAKGRSNATPVPADLQASVKKCEALEKEVRSLKMNLSFMNRKDSEQTKKIEELEQQREELLKEKKTLADELEQLSSRRTW